MKEFLAIIFYFGFCAHCELHCEQLAESKIIKQMHFITEF